jgi:hypothetical protein
MTRRLRRPSLLFALGVLAVAAVLAPAAAGARTVPARVQLVVTWGADAGSDAFRDDLRRAVAEDLATGCFSAVAVAQGPPAAEAADLVLELVLSGAVEETRFDDSIATALTPGEPAKDLRLVARCAVTVDATLSVRATGLLLRRKHFGVDVSRRPAYVGEEPKAEARAGAIDAALRSLARALGCGGSKLERTVADALAAGTGGAPRSR